MRFLTRYDGEVSEPLVGRQGSRVSMRVAMGSASLPLDILADADPQALLVGLRRVHPGIPVDAADLQHIAGLVQEGFKQFRSQFLHGMVQMVCILLFVGSRLCDTSLEAPYDVVRDVKSAIKIGHSYYLESRSILVLCSDKMEFR